MGSTVLAPAMIKPTDLWFRNDSFLFKVIVVKASSRKSQQPLGLEE